MSHRILILGGTGGTGRKIVRALQQLMPEATIHTGGRSYPLQPVGYGVEHVNIDVCRNDQEQEKTLSGYDLVILSLGPFTTLQTRAHELCIRAGVDWTLTTAPWPPEKYSNWQTPHRLPTCASSQAWGLTRA